MSKTRADSSEHAERYTDLRDCLLSKPQLAARLGVSLRTVESWMTKRLIPFVKIKKTVRFSWPDVEQALKQNFGVGYTLNHRSSAPRR
jgi:excisionase family DNA binding protein